jgi:hypothetical protein
MKTAEELLRELVDNVRPPKGCPIKLKEWPATELTVRNWIAICGDMPAPERARYDRKVVQLRQKNPQVDWSAVMTSEDSRRVILYLETD